MTKRWETTNMEVKDFIETMERYTGPSELDYVIVNNGKIENDIIEKYKREENKKPLYIKDLNNYTWKSFKIIERDIVNDEDFVRHDPHKLAKILEDIVAGWIK